MAEDQSETNEAEEGGSKFKLFLIIGIALLLIIGAVGAYLFLSGDDAAEGNGTEEIVEEDEGDKIAQYYAIPKDKEAGMVISLPADSEFRQAQVSFRIFTYSPALVEYLEKNDPMIRHHILNTLSLQETGKFLDRKGREEMQDALKKTLADLLAKSKVEEEQKLSKKIEAVYFTTFILQ